MTFALMEFDTICAIATPPGLGALGVVRISGPDCILKLNELFPTKDLSKQKGYTIHFGRIEFQGQTIDEVLLSLFRNPKSYTGEDLIELSCHGSPYILKQLLEALNAQGIRLAAAGEFTQRAFLNGKMDLSQAEAVGDLIASENSAAHRTALYQMRGGFSEEIKEMREKLIHFASMIELELDFSEEDVEFADRSELVALIEGIESYLHKLIESFKLGNVIRNGISVVIAGKPNAGKSTLLNALFNEERALVTELAGTTRDTIEEELVIEGIRFRFVDTAGLRETEDVVEALGVKRSYQKVQEASILLYLFDASVEEESMVLQELEDLKTSSDQRVLAIGNKMDQGQSQFGKLKPIFISAKAGKGLEKLKQALLSEVMSEGFNAEDTIVTNARHVNALQSTLDALERTKAGVRSGNSGDMVALDIRQALNYLSEITGDISHEDLLDNIFSKFCIGK
jgi:tRNA modification GTPase